MCTAAAALCNGNGDFFGCLGTKDASSMAGSYCGDSRHRARALLAALLTAHWALGSGSCVDASSVVESDIGRYSIDEDMLVVCQLERSAANDPTHSVRGVKVALRATGVLIAEAWTNSIGEAHFALSAIRPGCAEAEYRDPVSGRRATQPFCFDDGVTVVTLPLHPDRKLSRAHSDQSDLQMRSAEVQPHEDKYDSFQRTTRNFNKSLHHDVVNKLHNTRHLDPNKSLTSTPSLYTVLVIWAAVVFSSALVSAAVSRLNQRVQAQASKRTVDCRKQQAPCITLVGRVGIASADEEKTRLRRCRASGPRRVRRDDSCTCLCYAEDCWEAYGELISSHKDAICVMHLDTQTNNAPQR